MDVKFQKGNKCPSIPEWAKEAFLIIKGKAVQPSSNNKQQPSKYHKQQPSYLEQNIDKIFVPDRKSNEDSLGKFVLAVLEVLLPRWRDHGHPNLVPRQKFSIGGGTDYYHPINCKIKLNLGDVPDVGILYDYGCHDVCDSRRWQYPFVIGELKTRLKVENDDGAFYQLLSYQLAVQRPFLVEKEKRCSKMLGFLLDYTDGYIIELSFGEWTSPKPVTCTYINHYSTLFSIHNLHNIVGFLASIIDRLPLHGADSIAPLIVEPAPLFYFPWPTQGTRSSEQHPHISKYNHICIVEWDTISTWKLSTGRGFDNSTLFSVPDRHSKVVIKVSAPFMSGECDQHEIDSLKKLLEVQSAKLRFLKELYVTFYITVWYNRFFFSITHLINGPRVMDLDFEFWRSENSKKAKQLFFDDVYQVAMEAVEHQVLHWDIRPENVLFDRSRNRLIVIDWESVIPICPKYVDQIKIFLGSDNDHSSLYTKLAGPDEMRIFAALVLCEILMNQFSMLQIGKNLFFEEIRRYHRLSEAITSSSSNPIPLVATSTSSDNMRIVDAASARLNILPASADISSMEDLFSRLSLSRQSKAVNQSEWSCFRTDLNSIILNLLGV